MKDLRPGDLVRYGRHIWAVTESADGCSCVTLMALDDEAPLRVPLSLIEGACQVYLRAHRKVTAAEAAE